MSKAEDFYLKEYECLRREIEWLLSDYRSLERNAVIAVGISWAWLFAQRQEMPPWAWCFPCLFAILAAIRAWGIMRSFALFHEYMLGVEDWFSSGTRSNSKKHKGWNHFLDTKNIVTTDQRTLKKLMAILSKKEMTSASRMAGVFWIFLIVSTIAVAIFGSISKVSAVSWRGFPRL